MRFMMLMLPGEKAEAGVMPGPEAFQEMMKYNEALAVAWASRCPAMEDDRIELRQVQEMSDFPAEIVDAIGDSEAALRARLEQTAQA